MPANAATASGSVNRPNAHPSVYAGLYLPLGAVNGYLSVAIAYQLSQAGVSAESIGILIALYFMPHTWKFLWAPIVDMTLSSKRWYLIGAMLSTLGVLAMAVCSAPPVNLTALTVAAVLASLATTLLGMAVEALVAHSTSPDQQGRAGGWLQAGNFAGSGLGGGAALWLATHVEHAWITGAVLGACFLLCCLGLTLISDSYRRPREAGIATATLTVLRDVWSVTRSARGYLALLVLFLPIGSAGASALFSVIPDDWHTSATTVELVNGTLSGVISLLGCLAGGYLSDLINRKLAYVAYGLLLGLCALAMALAPHDQANYSLFVLLYSFISGLCYAGFSAVTLEAIGGGAAATKYNVFACLANMPTAYLAAIEGWARTHHGVNAFLYVDFAAPIFAALIYGAAVLRNSNPSDRRLKLSAS
jgi:MFS transporter, PAT family, beta-lactamase induction signal transducer AmpG